MTGVIRAGAFVAFGDGHEVMLPVRRLTGGLHELDTILNGVGSGERIRVGDPVSVRGEKVDPPRGRVDPVPA